jgi:hypothetical protein
MLDKNLETKYINQTNRKIEWRYKYCSKKYLLNSGTRCLKAHLRTIHLIYKTSPRDNKTKKRQLLIKDLITMAKKHSHSCRRLSEEASGLLINPNVLKKLYINFLVSCNQLFCLVKCPAF